MKHIVLLSLVLLAGCLGRAAAPPVPHPIATQPRAPSADPSRAYRARIALPGCTDEGVTGLLQSVEAIDEMIRLPRESRPGVEAVTRALDVAWVHPCLSHLARVDDPPWRASSLSYDALVILWARGLRGAMTALAGSLYLRDGRRFYLVPPKEAAPVALADLGAKERDAVRAFLCSAPDAGCGHAGALIARAERALDREEALATNRLRSPLGSPAAACVVSPIEKTAPGDTTAFERFAACATAAVPRTWRYPRPLRLRVRPRGWLVLRGRRGHYAFTDAVSAFDLATGAAYVARSSGDLVLAGSDDPSSVDARRRFETRVGTVSADHARELAFVLATAPLLRPARSEVQLFPVPPDLDVTFSESRPLPRLPSSDMGWTSSAHTTLAWSILDEGAVVGEGELLWPWSTNTAETYAGDLVRVLEAGLEPGCAPAPLPRGVARGPHGAVHPVDASAAAQDDVFGRLAGALERLAPAICPKREPR